MKDNANAIDLPTVEKLNVILRIFVADYLELDWRVWEDQAKINDPITYDHKELWFLFILSWSSVYFYLVKS